MKAYLPYGKTWSRNFASIKLAGLSGLILDVYKCLNIIKHIFATDWVYHAVNIYATACYRCRYGGFTRGRA